MYGQRVDPLILRRELETRRWNTNETFADYLHEKIALASRIPVPGNETICYVIDGISCQQLRIQARMQCFTSLEALLTAFANVPLPKEANPRQRREDYFSLKSGQQHSMQGRTSSGTSEPRRKQRDPDIPLKCYNCNEMGHFAASCTKPKREKGSCYKCGKFGHLSNQCQPVPMEVHCAEGEDEFRWSVEVWIGKFKSTYKALLDSGSPISFIKRRFIPRECVMFDVGTEQFYGLNRSSLQLLGCIEVTLIYDNIKYKIMLRVVPDETMNSDLILGRDFMKISSLYLCKRHESIGSNDILNIELDEISTLTEEISVNKDLPFELRITVQKLFQKFYVEPKRPLNPATENILTVTLTDKKPFSCVPRRLSYSEKAEVRKILEGLIAKIIIRESTSEYASPIVLVKKKTGETRMCVDFRKLNKVTLRDNFPLPLIEDQLDLLGGKKYFTSLDLKDGFFHIKMDEESIKYTSYVTQIFKKHIDSGEISIDMDDFLIATETIEQHLQILEKVFKLLVANRLELRLDKCKFLQTKLVYLGYTVTNEGIYPTEKGLEAVKNFPIPRNLRDIQSFLGMCSYFRKFVKNFSIIAKPLYDLTRKNVDFKFNETEEKAFYELKGRLIEAPILNCQALSLTLKKKETNPRIARWVLELENYDYTLEHRSGSRMLHVDALSRQIAVVEDNSIDRNLAICQNAALEKSVIHKYHNEMGHLGVEKTMGNILNNYWFPKMKMKVDQHIKSCLKCIAYTPVTGKQEGSLHNIPKVCKTIFDEKYKEFRNRGSCFTSREFEEFMKSCNVQHIKISTASPQSRVLEDVEFACNNSNSKATNECPSVLLYGVCQRGKVIDYLKDALELEGKISVNRDLEKCDKVMIRNFDNSSGVSPKLIPRFKGPYKVDRVLKNDRYVIKDVEGFQLTQIPYFGTWEESNMRAWTPG
ncbi:uncharacterized protein LOC143363195 [Halictus rubicundus]|uniref:uncharacterized protein LOC143363195 n=1 Tax=Halictus rubicundus TaxID=77578 RepID=UPI00403734CB